MVSPRKYLIEKVKKEKNLLKFALGAYSIMHPPPFRRFDMEFECDAWVGMSSLRCWNGRQIGEDNAGPYPYRQISGNQYETCRFRDSREGLPMNVTNLALVMPIAGDAYQFITALRNKYIAKRQLDSPKFNLVQAYLFAKYAVSLPAYLTRRKQNPLPDGNLQPIETAFYMVGTAPYLLVRQLMVRGDSTPLDQRPLSSQELYQLSDKSGVLISIRRKACPASAKLIRDLFDVIMNGGYEKPIDSPEVSRAFNDIGDWDRFHDYTLAASRLELLIKLSQAITAQSLFEIREKVGVGLEKSNGQLDRVMRNALTLSHAKFVEVDDVPQILKNVIEILNAILMDHGEVDTLRQLKGELEGKASSSSTNSDSQVMKRRLDIVKAACIREQKAAHNALGHQDWPQITDEDFYRRSGGEELEALLTQL